METNCKLPLTVAPTKRGGQKTTAPTTAYSMWRKTPPRPRNGRGRAVAPTTVVHSKRQTNLNTHTQKRTQKSNPGGRAGVEILVPVVVLDSRRSRGERHKHCQVSVSSPWLFWKWPQNKGVLRTENSPVFSRGPPKKCVGSSKNFCQALAKRKNRTEVRSLVRASTT